MKITTLLSSLMMPLLLLACASPRQKESSEAEEEPAKVYEPTAASIAQHPVPEWFKDAKLGIFIHWGLYSVPGWAKGTEKPLEEILANSKGEEWFANNPYAEWYLNSLKIPGSATQQYHEKTFGKDFTYDDFVPIFNEEIKKWKPEEWAKLFKAVGARYVVLTTKHHDGFLLWPSDYPNPFKENYEASRDLVGELTQAVKAQEMKIGLYYSSGLDWTFNDHPVKTFPDLFQAVPQQETYVTYITHHWEELIDRYHPSVLWADIGSPKAYDPVPVIADFYNSNPEGVVNNRHKMETAATSTAAPVHYDFTTPEYQVLDSISPKKWETCRGIGLSFGYNRTEDAEEFLSVDELVDSFVDIVSKNGNLLLNVGPKADGTIPEGQKERLLGLGNWLQKNGEAIFATRPWKKAEAQTTSGGQVRFTQKENYIYMILLDQPSEQQVVIPDIGMNPISSITELSKNKDISFRQEDNRLILNLADQMPPSEAYAFKIE